MVNTVFTIGSSKKSLQEFVELLQRNNIKKIVDIRLNTKSQLLGFAKGRDLSYFLENFLNIKYVHNPEFAPTNEILEDYRKTKDWKVYTSHYLDLLKERKIGKRLQKLLNENGLCFLCSEESPEKCHRRLLIEYAQRLNPTLKVVHLQ